MSLISNRKARFEYEILKIWEAGVELLGFEVKSVRAGQGSLAGAYVTVRGDGAWLIGAQIPAYQPANTPGGYSPKRDRRLLLTKNELRELVGAVSQAGLTIVPLSMYNKRAKIKVDIALVRGKKRYDKRQTIKKRESEKEIQRTLKRQFS